MREECPKMVRISQIQDGLQQQSVLDLVKPNSILVTNMPTTKERQLYGLSGLD